MEKILQMAPAINSPWQLAAFSVALIFLILAFARMYKSKSQEPDPTIKMITRYLFIISFLSIVAGIALVFWTPGSLTGGEKGNTPTPPNSTPAPGALPTPKQANPYEDVALSAVGSKSSLDDDGRKAIIVLQIKNKHAQELFIAHDRHDAITATTNTGETINNQSCSLPDIRSISFNNLRNQVDQRLYTTIAGGQSISISIKCNLSVKNAKKVTQLSVTLPLVRIEGEEVKHFTISIPAINIEK